MTVKFRTTLSEHGYYLFWERTSTGFSSPTIGEYFPYLPAPDPTPYFQVAGSEMDFHPREMGLQGMGHDWYYGPLDIKVPKLPGLPK